MNKGIICILIAWAIFLSGCQSTSKSKAYFAYDQVEHYNSNIEYADLPKFAESMGNDSLIYAVSVGYIPKTINDTQFVSRLEQLNYTKTDLARSKFDKLNNIFSEKEAAIIMGTLCKPMYRDILVFRKKGKITGIAKLCLDCREHIIVGTSVYTGYFGQNGDYERLEKLLATN